MPILFEVHVPTANESRIFQEVALQFGWSIGSTNEVVDTQYKYIQIWNDKSLMRDMKYNSCKKNAPLISTKDAINYFVTGKSPIPPNKCVTLGTYKAELLPNGSLKVGCQTITKEQIDNLLNAMNGKDFVENNDDIPF